MQFLWYHSRIKFNYFSLCNIYIKTATTYDQESKQYLSNLTVDVTGINNKISEFIEVYNELLKNKEITYGELSEKMDRGKKYIDAMAKLSSLLSLVNKSKALQKRENFNEFKRVATIFVSNYKKFLSVHKKVKMSVSMSIAECQKKLTDSINQIEEYNLIISKRINKCDTLLQKKQVTQYEALILYIEIW